jgi:ABC-type Fe3+ transport system substrate-binding protein
MTQPRFSWIWAVVGAAFFVAALPAARAAELSPAMAQAVAAANKEGTLKLIWSPETLGGAAGAKRAETEMHDAFGTSFAVKFSPGAGSMAVVGSTVLAALKAGRDSSTDVYIGATTFAANFADAGMFQSVDYPALLPGRITPEIVEAKGGVIRFVSFIAGMTYNTALLPHPPQTVEAWLDPSLKGKIASTPAGAGLDVLAANDFWGEQKTLAFTEKFSNQIAGLIRCGDTDRIASGEYLALMFDCGGSDAWRAQAAGAPIDQVVATDFVQLRFFYLGIPKNAPDPNAAKVFIAYLMTPAGQKFSWDTWKEDLHSFPGSHVGAQIAALRAKGAEPRVLDIDWTNRHPEIPAAREKILKIIQRGP